MMLFSDLLRFGAASEILVLLLVFSGHKNKSWNPNYFYPFFYCLVGYLVAPLVFHNDVPFLIYFLVLLFSSLLPFAFLIFCRALFRESYHISLKEKLFLILLLAYFGYGILYVLTNDNAINIFLKKIGGIEYRVISLTINISLIIFILWDMISTWANDLIIQRRAIRAVIVGITVFYISAVIIVENWFSTSVPAILEVVNAILLFLIISTICVLLLRYQTATISVISEYTPARNKPVSPQNEAIVRKLDLAIEEKTIFHIEGLTITHLASALNIQEYILRRVINTEMGFKNFNQFLNYYRIVEAEKYLIEKTVPILTIALELGYRSMSTFNKAFRDKHSMTPKEFRQKNRS